MANQVIVTNTGNVQVALTPPANVQVQISRAAIGTVSNVPTANFANFAGNVTASNQPNITSLGTLGNLVVSGQITTQDLVVTGNFQVGNLVANSANFANFAGEAFNVNVSNVAGIGNIATVNLDGNIANVLRGDGSFSGEAANLNANYANFAGQVVDATQSNITAVGTLSSLSVSGNISTPTLFSQGMVVQGYDFVQMQYSNGVALPVTPYDIGTGSWFYLDAGGAVWQSNTTGTLQTVVLDNNGNVSATGNIIGGNANLGNLVTANYFSGDGSLLSNISLNNISNGTSNVSIPVANSNVQVYANNQNWTFTDVGNLLLAGGNGVIQSIANSSLDPINPNVSTMVLTPDQGNSSQALVLDPTTPGHIHLRAPGSNIDQPQANVYLGGEISSFEVGVFNGAVPNLFIHSNNNTWMFDITGNLTLPGNSFAVNYANGTQVPLDGPVANANYANFAGTAYSVDGANVSGTVANANYSAYAGEANTANLATYATTANSVAGANVSGEVANANYSTYSGTAGTANSVAVGNVSGIGNIATINLDGSSSNVLFGNGVFAPESTSIANANYANFAGQVVDATQSNITQLGNLVDLRISNANIHLGSNAGLTTQSANSVAIGTNAGQTNQGNGITNARAVAIGFNTANLNQGDSAVAVGRGSGQNTQGNSAVAIGWSAAGNNQSANAVAIGTVAGNTFQGLNSIAIGMNAGRITQGSNSIAIGMSAGYTSQANNSIILNASGANLDFTTANSFVVKPVRNVLTGNVMFYDNTTGEISYDVLGNASVGNANFANFAGNVTVSSQPNITTLGNLLYLNVANGTNVTSTVMNFAPDSIGFNTSIGSNVAYNLVTQYGPNASANVPKNIVIRSRGNVSTPLTTVTSDRIVQNGYYAYNGTSNTAVVSETITIANLNSNSNAAYSGGNWSVTTGNPYGDWGNANSSSAFHQLSLDQFGTITVQQGSAPAGSGVNTQLNLISYGGTNGNTNAVAPGMFMRRARGNRDANVTVEPNDQIGRVVFQGYNGSIFQTNRVGMLRGVVDSTYVGGNTNIPIGLQLITCDNATSYTTDFYANGVINFGGNITSANVTGNVTSGNLLAVGNVIADKIFSNSYIQANSYVQAVNINANANLTVGNGAVSSIIYNTGDKTTNSFTTLNDTQFKVTMDGVNPTTGFSPFFFSVFDSAYTQVPPSYMYRARGSVASPSAVASSDEVYNTSYLVYADSGNTYYQVFNQKVVITGNDGVGNVTGNMNFTTFNTGSNINLSASNTYANNFTANNVSVNSGGFMKLASYTAAALTAITGQIGWMASVSNSGGGGNPNGMIAFWDTTHSRWSYIHDNSAV